MIFKTILASSLLLSVLGQVCLADGSIHENSDPDTASACGSVAHAGKIKLGAKEREREDPRCPYRERRGCTGRGAKGYDQFDGPYGARDRDDFDGPYGARERDDFDGPYGARERDDFDGTYGARERGRFDIEAIRGYHDDPSRPDRDHHHDMESYDDPYRYRERDYGYYY
ncbi:hypothetical protein MDAP_001653 [Mitosporidium daphniae]|uniref:Uncharacterized protein n=1 Tax=Mitosporidium daphniae TaxID=1485682 RepID=A0A098VPQ2_9MICR|nr:uncharacterized protein DI09_48p90 [Mitosporidium daphniae]XP_013239323.1 uncharacterized protein DI09_128p20 [Mitosporidium daphniae]KGG51003.1 hypothetical protein DI09_48p90 [Mitosporidium daphniae]KGG52887.1 hypothetical protein DI09_128p20 [Mitosporidium daphniae]|eukprot:XP_013237454.1 uncharacterized protein DI09_48p90 [Mitosporidium daphniae]